MRSPPPPRRNRCDSELPAIALGPCLRRCFGRVMRTLHAQVPQRASRKDDVGPVKRAAYAHIMRTGRFPSFDELKAELRAAVAAGDDGNQRSAASLLKVRHGC